MTTKALTGPPGVADKLLGCQNCRRVGVISSRAGTMGVDWRRWMSRRTIWRFRMTPTSNSVLKTYCWDQDGLWSLQTRKIMRDLNQGVGGRNQMIGTFNDHIIHKGPKPNHLLIWDNVISVFFWIRLPSVPLVEFQIQRRNSLGCT